MLTYREYYAMCRMAYNEYALDVGNVYHVLVHPHYPHAPELGEKLKTSPEYPQLIEALAGIVSKRLEDPQSRYLDTEVDSFAMKLDDFWGIEEIERLAEILVPQVEQNIYGCYALVNQVNVYRSRCTLSSPVSSWLWHYDDNPEESIKILIYLTDVGEEHGPFEYLLDSITKQAVKIQSSRISYDERVRPRWERGRVPAAQVAKYLASGYETHRVVGKKGTLILFDNNCIHRATVPIEGYRDVIVYNLRPCHKIVRPLISRQHTGSWGYNPKKWDPSSIAIAFGDKQGT